MTKLETLIELNYLEKQHRKNRLEDKLKQQEYYGEIEELFDPLTKTLNANSEQNLALSEQTLRAIDWQNQELDKQTNMIQPAGSQFNEALMKSNGEALVKSNDKDVEKAQDKPGMLVDKGTAQIINLMSVQSNPQLKLKFGNLDIGEFEMNGVKLVYQENAFMVKDNIYELSEEFINFLINPIIKHGEIEEGENKIKRFLKDIRYDLGKGDKKSARYRTLKRIIGAKNDVYGRGLNSNPDPHSLIERLELLILETKAGHDGLYDEMLVKSKQLLSMDIINQEQVDNFVFNYGKQIMMEKQQQHLLAKAVFSPQITKFRRERVIPLYKDETWSADLIDKSSLS